MFFPEYLYQLSARDQQVTWLDPLLSRTQLSNAAVTVVPPDIAVPDGRVLILQSLVLGLVPGAAQSVVNASIIIRAPTGGTDIALTGLLTTPAAGFARVLWTGSIAIPPQWIIRGTGIFSAGAAANQVNFDLVGLLIPVGNVQRV